MIKEILIASLVIASISICRAETSQGSPGADLIVFNAKIYTGCGFYFPISIEALS